MQQRAQTDATCNIQQCWELLVNNVASVCTQPYAQPAIGVIGIPWGPQGCAQRKALESQLFLVHLSAPGLTSEKISVSRGEAQPFGKFTPAERPGNSL